ncbi:hypothetical protein TcasGA2_TC014521 [Tribolium castaneum]|uniref:Uncharacterized protein n=1 Tax=Tribolium castaneum TaxID=7070 RepID=D6WP47_TRICA|nr:hypothetical protein TcasGA2_TC014521 [Tribolium castaneum]
MSATINNELRFFHVEKRCFVRDLAKLVLLKFLILALLSETIHGALLSLCSFLNPSSRPCVTCGWKRGFPWRLEKIKRKRLITKEEEWNAGKRMAVFHSKRNNILHLCLR